MDAPFLWCHFPASVPKGTGSPEYWRHFDIPQNQTPPDLGTLNSIPSLRHLWMPLSYGAIFQQVFQKVTQLLLVVTATNKKELCL